MSQVNIHNLKVSLVICGPILTRTDKKTFRNGLNRYRQDSRINQIVISTFENELTQDLSELVDDIVINDDPGVDLYGDGLNFISGNLTRLLTSTKNGLLLAKEDIAIKTRIEFVPGLTFDLDEFLNKYQKNLLNEKILVIADHYYPTGFRLKNPLFWFPDTLQIGHTKSLRNIWERAADYWELNKGIYLNRKFSFFNNTPPANEQILGLGLIGDNKLILKNRFSVSLNLAKQSIQMQSQTIFPIPFEEFNLESNRKSLISSKINLSLLSNYKKFIIIFTKISNRDLAKTLILLLTFLSFCFNFYSRMIKGLYYLAVKLKHKKFP